MGISGEEKPNEKKVCSLVNNTVLLFPSFDKCTMVILTLGEAGWRVWGNSQFYLSNFSINIKLLQNKILKNHSYKKALYRPLMILSNFEWLQEDYLSTFLNRKKMPIKIT